MAHKAPVQVMTDEDGSSDEPGVAAVNRALSILDAFTEDAPMLTLTQLSQRTGLYKSTILRLMQSLESYGYIHRLNSGVYMLGPSPIRLAALATKALHPAELIMPVLRELVQATSESASFYVRSGTMRLCSFRVDSPRAVRDHVQVGELLPLDKGAAGHVLVEFERFASDADTLSIDRLIRITRGERDVETAAVACPVFGEKNILQGALSLSGPITRFGHAEVATMIPALIAAARTLTIRFKGNPSLFSSANETFG
jgi:DNA-binding IclR family transcriptional regulator